jgi:hypothetical protein
MSSKQSKASSRENKVQEIEEESKALLINP